MKIVKQLLDNFIIRLMLHIDSSSYSKDKSAIRKNNRYLVPKVADLHINI